MEHLIPELINNIYQFLEPCWHYNLATTCKSVYFSSEHILRRHRAAYENLRISSDSEPLAIVALLRGVLDSVGIEAIDAWHVREYEVWGSRVSWDDWQQWKVNQDGAVSLENNAQLTIQRSRIEMLANAQLRELTFLATDDYDSARMEIENGGDGFMKMLIISKLPRLRALRLAEREQDQHTSLEWMRNAVNWILEGRTSWPVGYKSIRKVAVGVTTRSPEHSNGAAGRAADLAVLVRLPNIEEVYFRNLDMIPDGDLEDLEEAADRFKLPASCSSVKRIILDRIKEDSDAFRQALFMAPSALEALVLRGHEEKRDYPMDGDMIPIHLSDSPSGASLRRFFYYQPDCINGRDSRSYYPSVLLEMNRIGMVSTCVQDVIIEALGEARNRKDDWCESIDHDELVDAFLRFLPATLEVLVLWGKETFDDGNEWLNRGEHEENETIDDAIVAMMESSRFGNLQAVYLAPIETSVDTSMPDPKAKVCFQKAIEAGQRHGVKVHTVANWPKSENALDFVPIPDKYDMKTGPMGERDKSCITDPFTGKWISPECHGCGECEKCLMYYTREAWKDFKTTHS